MLWLNRTTGSLFQTNVTGSNADFVTLANPQLLSGRDPNDDPEVIGVRDYNHDGFPDILWRHRDDESLTADLSVRSVDQEPNYALEQLIVLQDGNALIVAILGLLLSLGCKDEAVGPDHRGAAGADGMVDVVDCSSTAESDARECASRADCVHAEYPRGVASENDCYCPLCPGDFGLGEPLNTWSHDCFREQWLARCTDWIRLNPCPPVPCPTLAPPSCAAGRCTP